MLLARGVAYPLLLIGQSLVLKLSLLHAVVVVAPVAVAVDAIVVVVAASAAVVVGRVEAVV